MKHFLARLAYAIGLIALYTTSLTADEPAADLAARAISADPEVAAAAIAALRDRGPDGLKALLDFSECPGGRQPLADDARARLNAALDAVGGQRDCSASRLFWHTDLDKAKAEAQATGRPIVSLHMLGKLTDEFSCANSRFFRTTLYANKQISDVLRERFVLHWQSVRPVPRVTIDFGDGRKLERTLTGNSVHYILDSQGRPVDALPGLYGPAAFLRGLERAEQVARTSAGVDASTRSELLAVYHRSRIDAIVSEWSDDLSKLGIAAAGSGGRVPRTARQVATATARNQAAQPAPPAERATRLAQPKARVELPILAAVSRVQSLDTATDEETWNRIAELHADDAVLDDASRALMRRHHFGAEAAGRRAITKRVVEDPLLRVVAQFQRSAALDTVRNEYQLHRQIHEWFLAGEPSDLAQLNERVYAELFLTPSSDPWLGLAPDDTYTALDRNGVVQWRRGD